MVIQEVVFLDSLELLVSQEHLDCQVVQAFLDVQDFLDSLVVQGLVVVLDLVENQE